MRVESVEYLQTIGSFKYAGSWLLCLFVDTCYFLSVSCLFLAAAVTGVACNRGIVLCYKGANLLHFFVFVFVSFFSFAGINKSRLVKRNKTEKKKERKKKRDLLRGKHEPESLLSHAGFVFFF